MALTVTFPISSRVSLQKDGERIDILLIDIVYNSMLKCIKQKRLEWKRCAILLANYLGVIKLSNGRCRSFVVPVQEGYPSFQLILY